MKRTPFCWIFICAFLMMPIISEAKPSYAITLYNEAPKYPENFQHFDYVNPDAPKGGTLHQAGFGDFDSLNPFINKGVPANGIMLMYDTLTVQSLDEPFTEYGLIARRIEKASDNSWVRFYLRPEARFSDNTVVTAEDVKFSFNLLLKKGAPQYRSYYADISKVIVEDPLTVRFVFKHNDNRELPLILGQLPVLPKHYWAKKDFEKSNLKIPIGSGPYVISQIKSGRSIHYKRVKNWWAKDLSISRGMYNFDEIYFDYYRDSGIALEALKSENFDFWLEISAKNWANSYNIPAVKEHRLIKKEFENRNPSGMQGFVFNTRRPMFKDIRIRKALGLLFDFEWSNKQLFNGSYVRSKSYFDNSDLAATGLPSKEELQILEPLRKDIPLQVFTDEFKNPVTDATGRIRTKRRQAYKLFKQAGWYVKNDQMFDQNHKPVHIEFLLAQPAFERVLLPFKRNVEDLGISFDIRRVDISQYVNRLRSRDFDMIVGVFPQSSSPGNEQRDYWYSTEADNPGSQNFIGLKNPAIDKLVDGLINANSRKELLTYTHALDRTLLWGYYVIPNWHITTWRVAYWNTLKHPKKSPAYDIGLYTWWSANAEKNHDQDSAESTPIKKIEEQ